MSSLMSAMWFSEQARRTAPLKSLSSLTATREVSDSSGSYNWAFLAYQVALSMLTSHVSHKSLITLGKCYMSEDSQLCTLLMTLDGSCAF